ncbi:MAG: PAS domain S-box protein, partial [Acidobacteriota bacterium]
GSVRREGIEIEQGRQLRGVNVEVRPLLAARGRERYFLILFEEASLRDQPPAMPAAGKGKKLQERELLRVRNELARTREYVQAIIRDQESTNDELKTANEEALSNMEELQSTNEELETAKEELQSGNEELVTVNEQLQNRNAELAHRSDELTNVLNGAGIPMLILGGDRRIRLFTTAAEKVLGLVPADVGRPIRNLRLGVHVPDLEELIPAVVEKGGDVRREVQGDNGRWYAVHMRPFLTGERTIEGVLIAFVDIHDFKRGQEVQKERNFLAEILDAAKDLLVVIRDREGRIVHFNRVCQQITGYSLEEVKGRKPWELLVVPEEAASVRATLRQVYGGTAVQRESHWLAKDGKRLLISWSNSVVKNDDDSVKCVIGIGTDVTDREAAQVHAQESDSTVRAMMETASQAILAVSQSGRIMMANPAAERMYGYDGQELVGLPIENLMPERYRERNAVHLMKWFSQPSDRPMSVGMELSCLRRDGGEFPVEVSLSSINTRNGTLGVAFIADIAKRKENERTLLASQHQLQTLAAGLIATQESGNRELARELHDVFSQDLAGIGMEISSFLKEESKSDDNLVARLSDLGKKITRLATDMHRTSREIHPAIVEELGLEPALRQECDAFQQRSRIPTQFTAENVPAELPTGVALCLYRVAQESLRNIHKHSRETDWVHVSLGGGRQRVTLRIEDAGDGFELNEALKKGGLGLISMEERIRLVNGELTIQSQPGKGTTVTAFVPLETVPLKKAT